MADDIQETLQKLFINNGARINPGDPLFFKTFELPEGQEMPILNVIKDQVNEINKGTDRRHCISPIYNTLIHIFHKMEFVWKYFCGEFEIRCRDRYFREQFARVWPEFIRGWYFGTVYVGYGADFEEIDRRAFEKDGEVFDLDCVTGRFRLYTKTANGRFYSIFTKQGNLEFDRGQINRLVKCQCEKGSNISSNWLYWFYLWTETLDGLDRYQIAVKALSKKVILTPKNKEEKEAILHQMDDKSTIVSRSSSSPMGETGETTFTLGKTKVEPLEFMNNDTPARIFEGIQKYFEFMAAHLGFSGEHTEQKKERLTAAENWPKQKTVSNVRTYLINSLNACFDEMRAKFGDKVVPEDLKIVPTNQAFAQGLPVQQQGGTFGNKFGGYGYKMNNFFKQEESWRGND